MIVCLSDGFCPDAPQRPASGAGGAKRRLRIGEEGTHRARALQVHDRHPVAPAPETGGRARSAVASVAEDEPQERAVRPLRDTALGQFGPGIPAMARGPPEHPPEPERQRRSRNTIRSARAAHWSALRRWLPSNTQLSASAAARRAGRPRRAGARSTRAPSTSCRHGSRAGPSLSASRRAVVLSPDPAPPITIIRFTPLF